MNDSSYNLVQAIRGPIMLILLGTLVAMDYFGVYGFSRTWPILIIAFGLLKLLEKLVAQPLPPPPMGPPPIDNHPQGGNVI
ncbi:MAG TPA: hypothetical protein VNV82_09845 [Bryobacteraceae bacterium]|nr:hypothetical protein [Bryobacteraceae bacterium]